VQIKDEWAKPGLYVITFENGAQYVGMSSVSVRARAEALSRPEVRARMADGQRRSWTPERRARFADSKRGEAAPCAKLQAEDVRLIKVRLAAKESCASISRSFGVTPEAISRIKCGTSWAHVA